MFEQLVQQYGGDAVLKNNAIPNEQINETSNSIFAGLQKIASEGGDFLKYIEHLKRDGRLKHVGQGTLKRDQPLMEIYKGEGLTYVGKKLRDGYNGRNIPAAQVIV